MSFWNIIEFTQMVFGLIPKILNAVDVVLVVFFTNEIGAMIDPIMLEGTYIQNIIT